MCEAVSILLVVPLRAKKQLEIVARSVAKDVVIRNAMVDDHLGLVRNSFDITDSQVNSFGQSKSTEACCAVSQYFDCPHAIGGAHAIDKPHVDFDSAVDSCST